MKTTIIVVLAMLCSVAMANEPNEAVSLWVTGSNPAYQNTNIGIMLGFVGENKVEIGGAIDWRQYSEGDVNPDDQSDLSLGIYGIVHLDVIDINNPIELPYLPEKLASEPCLGVSYLFDTDGKGTSITPFVGLRIFDLFALIYEYNTYQGVPVSDVGKLALSVRYKF